ncbi:gamma-glutamylcyclotransferase family protein [Streptomyces sp. NPDC059850]|uniref:gamma-glutamylcyclotransferase family protein n=1 Tax=Streptomyces sp. NPDC059850 TaxID=3346970 RepID=UPI00364B4C30
MKTGLHMTQTINLPRPAPENSGHRDRLAQNPDRLFCYGTLQFDDVLEALLGRIPARTPASAPGWRAAALEGRVYPGLVVNALGGAAAGMLLTGLSDEEWAILDAFEDRRYELLEIPLANGERGWAYIWQDGEVREEDWDAETFETQHLEEYAARCARISEKLTADLREGAQ